MKARLICSLLALMVGAVFVRADSMAVPAGMVQPAPYYRYEDTGVFHVKNNRDADTAKDTDPCSARRDDVIWIYVKHLNSWLNDPQQKEMFPKNPKIADLVPFLNDVPLKGIHPDQFAEWPAADATPPKKEGDSATAADASANPSYPQVHYLRFTLHRTDTSKDAWTQILNRPNFTRPMKVSIGFENGEEMRSWVLPKPTAPENVFVFTLIPPLRFWLGTVVVLGALAIFLYLARWTDIMRDTEGPLRPDKRRPYSLSRAQMAFWFFLVVGSFFFLWVIIGDTDTLNPSVLGLIGISATTALGAALIDSGKKSAPPSESDLPAVNLSQPRRMIRVEIAKLIAKAKEELQEIEKERAAIDSAEEANLAANAAAQANKTQQITDLQRQLDYFEWPSWKGMMFDLLAENNVVCFHRFQIFVWTIVLGIMFVANVYSQLAMPEFSATLLGLLGISAGTYVGFKIPENNKTKDAA